MELSHFYKDKLVNRFPVTMLLLEYISLRIAEEQELPEEQRSTLEEFILKALQNTGTISKPTKEDILYVYLRMQEMDSQQMEALAEASKNAPAKSKKNFASDYLEWVSNLNHEQMCLYAADYNYDRASYLYNEVDRDAVLFLSKHKAESDWNDKITAFEACLFGFGGGYGEGSNEKVYDLTKDREAAEMGIRAAGF